jgi:hypothetical protein
MLRISMHWWSEVKSVSVLVEDLSRNKYFLQVRISHIHLCYFCTNIATFILFAVFLSLFLFTADILDISRLTRCNIHWHFLATLPSLLHFIFISLWNHCLSLRQRKKYVYRNTRCRYNIREWHLV